MSAHLGGTYHHTWVKVFLPARVKHVGENEDIGFPSAYHTNLSSLGIASQSITYQYLQLTRLCTIASLIQIASLMLVLKYSVRYSWLQPLETGIRYIRFHATFQKRRARHRFSVFRTSRIHCLSSLKYIQKSAIKLLEIMIGSQVEYDKWSSHCIL